MELTMADATSLNMRGMNEPKKKTMHTIYCKHDDLKGLKGDYTFLLCNAINSVTKWQAIGAQKLRGAWVIAIRTKETRSAILQQETILVRDREVKVHPLNPFMGGTEVKNERVVVKDYPMDEDESCILEYFNKLSGIDLVSSVVHSSKARNLANGLSSYLNGDKYVFVKSGFNSPIPERARINGHTCRFWYASRIDKCARCNENHKTSETTDCLAFRATQPNVKVFAWGPLSNFYNGSMKMDNMTFVTSEHCYQWHACTEMLRDDIAEKVFHARTPKEAKQLASEVKLGSNVWGTKRDDVMRNVIRAKAASNKEFRDELLNSGDKLLVESSPSDTYWASGLDHRTTLTTDPSYYPGQNTLGKILTEVRSELRGQTPGAGSSRADNVTPTTETSSSDQPATDPELTSGTAAASQPDQTERPSRPLHRIGAQSRASSVPNGAVLDKVRGQIMKKFLKQQTKPTKRLGQGSPLGGSKGDLTKSQTSDRTVTEAQDDDTSSMTSFTVNQLVDNFRADTLNNSYDSDGHVPM